MTLLLVECYDTFPAMSQCGECNKYCSCHHRISLLVGWACFFPYGERCLAYFDLCLLSLLLLLLINQAIYC